MKGPSRNPLESYKKIVILEVVIYKDKGKLIYENLNEMNNYLILIILLFCITGCKEKRPAIKEAVFEFNPNNILVCDTLDINQICDSFRYIPLETRDSVLIEEVTDVRLTDDRIVVRDGQRLLVFDQNGRFLNKIGKRGRAPGEYGAIDHFYISKKQEIVIFDPILLSLHFYTLNNRFIKSINIRPAVLIPSSDGKEVDSGIQNIYPLNDTLLFLAHSISRFSDILYSLYNLQTGKLKVISHLEQKIKMEVDSWRYSILPVAQYGDSLTCILPFSNILYRFADTSLIPLYAVNPIPKQEIPENYLANRKTKNNTQLQEEWIRRKYVVPVNIMEIENNLIVENAIGGKNYYLFWNKNSRQGIFAEINSVDPNIVPMLIVRGMSRIYVSNGGKSC